MKDFVKTLSNLVKHPDEGCVPDCIGGLKRTEWVLFPIWFPVSLEHLAGWWSSDSTLFLLLWTEKTLSLFCLGVQFDEKAAHRATVQSYFHNLSHSQLWDCWESDSWHGILLSRKQLFSLHSQTWHARKSMHCPHKSPHFLSIQETVTHLLAPDILRVSVCLWDCSANQNMFINENKHKNATLSVRHLLCEGERCDWIRLCDEYSDGP